MKRKELQSHENRPEKSNAHQGGPHPACKLQMDLSVPASHHRDLCDVLFDAHCAGICDVVHEMGWLQRTKVQRSDKLYQSVYQQFVPHCVEKPALVVRDCPDAARRLRHIGRFCTVPAPPRLEVHPYSVHDPQRHQCGGLGDDLQIHFQQ